MTPENLALRRKKNEKYRNLIYIIPMLLIICLFIIIPVFQVISTSFFNVKTNGTRVFIGLDNYRKFFASDDGKLAMKNTVIWVLGGTALKIIIGMVIALILYQKFKGKHVLTALTLIPYATPSAVSCMIWRLMYHPVYGHINQILTDLGLMTKPISFLGNMETSLVAVMIVNIWAVAPFCALNILSALYAIPGDVYEAAQIDGATSFKKFIHITLPLVFADVRTLALLIGIWGFNSFDVIYIMTTGGPANSSSIIVNQIYQYAFEFNNRGYSSAMSVIAFLILSLFAILYIQSKEKNEIYE